MDKISAREEQVLKLLTLGYTNRAIAHSLRISYFTARNHITNIYEKLDVHNRAQASVIYTRYLIQHEGEEEI